MAYQIDAEGRIKLGNRLVPISTRISEAAQRFLATPPWGDGPPPRVSRSRCGPGEATPHAHWHMLNLPEAREAVNVMAQFFLKYLGKEQS